MHDIKIVNVDQDNISQYGPTCFLNLKNEGYQIKLEWLKKRFSEGLKIKLLYLEKKKKVMVLLNMPILLTHKTTICSGCLYFPNGLTSGLFLPRPVSS